MHEKPVKQNADVPSPCPLDDEMLLDYLLEHVSDDVRATIEHTPACLVRVAEMRQTIAQMEQRLYRASCPDVETLVAYQEHHLTGTEYLVVHTHVGGCVHCQEEVHAMNAADAIPLFPETPLAAVERGVHHLVEAIARPQTALGALGSPVVYESPHLQITLALERMPGHARTWIVTGDVRTTERLPAGDLVESVQLQRSEPSASAPLVGEVDADGSFELADVRSGVYQLRLLTAHEDILIRDLSIGDEA